MTRAKVRLAMASMGEPGTNVGDLCKELGVTRQTWGQTTPRTGLKALGIPGKEADAWLNDGPENDPFSAWLQNA